MKISIKILLALALIFTGIWVYQRTDVETIIIFLCVLASFLGLFVNDEIQKRKRQKKSLILKPVIERIQREKPNFKHILDKKPYSSLAHQKAVEVYSFELLLNDIHKLQEFRKYRFLVKNIIFEVKRNLNLNEKDTSNLLEYLYKLEKKLKKESSG
jgi:hypothetical protein